MAVRHYLTDLDFTAEEQARVLERARIMKAAPADYRHALDGKVLGMIFTKSSTRTRVSFESGIIQLGGQAIFLTQQAAQFGRGEPMSDTGAVLSRYLDIIMIRTFNHRDIVDLAAASTVPVINGLDDVYHPCQVLADLQTIQEKKGTLKGLRLAYVGDGNNVSHSLMLGAGLAGIHVVVVCPLELKPDDTIVREATAIAEKSGGSVTVTAELAGVEGADVVYTDVWASMGQEKTAGWRKMVALAPYQINADLMDLADREAIFLHCLPAHRGEEVAAEVIDGPQSRVFDQAENRLHAQKALMMFLLDVGV